MMMSTVALWSLLAVGFLVLEACTVAMVSLWFAIGAAAALVLSLLGAAFWIQTAAFLVVSGVLLALLRPMMRKYVKSPRPMWTVCWAWKAWSPKALTMCPTRAR